MLGTKDIAKLTPYLTEKKVVNLEIKIALATPAAA